jgi:hypothetical protein
MQSIYNKPKGSEASGAGSAREGGARCRSIGLMPSELQSSRRRRTVRWWLAVRSGGWLLARGQRRPSSNVIRFAGGSREHQCLIIWRLLWLHSSVGHSVWGRSPPFKAPPPYVFPMYCGCCCIMGWVQQGQGRQPETSPLEKRSDTNKTMAAWVARLGEDNQHDNQSHATCNNQRVFKLYGLATISNGAAARSTREHPRQALTQDADPQRPDPNSRRIMDGNPI